MIEPEWAFLYDEFTQEVLVMTTVIVVFTIIGLSWILFEVLNHMAMKKDQAAMEADFASLLMECSLASSPLKKRELRKRLNESFAISLELCQRYSRSDPEVLVEKMPVLYMNNACINFLEELDGLPASSQQENRKLMKEAALAYQELSLGVFETEYVFNKIEQIRSRSSLPSFLFLCQILEELAGTTRRAQDSLALVPLTKGITG